MIYVPIFQTNPNMRYAWRKLPGDDVSRMVVRNISVQGQCVSLPFKISHDVRYPSMIDVGIGRGGCPLVRVSGKVLPHIFMYQLLQVDLVFPQHPDDHIGAGPARGYITAGIGNGIITGIIKPGLFVAKTDRRSIDSVFHRIGHSCIPRTAGMRIPRISRTTKSEKKQKNEIAGHDKCF